MERFELNRVTLSTKKLRILIRTSGGKAPKKELVLGHIFRCLNLSEFLKKHKLYFLVEDFGGTKKIISEKKIHNVNFLQKNLSRNNDITQTIDFIINNKIDIIIVDKYNISITYLQKLKKSAKVIYISDLTKIDFPVDLVINGFIGFSNSIMYNSYNTKCLVGPKFMILNNKFSKKSITKKFDLLISFGGYDENNISTLVLKELLKQNYDLKVKIILGPSSPIHKIMKQKNFSNNSITNLTSVKNMYEHISTAKYGLCSGGMTTYEFASQNIPFAIISQVKHQLKTAKIWENKENIKNLGMINSGTPKKIQKLLMEISLQKNKFSFPKRSLIDAKGGKRVAHEIEHLI